MRFSFDLEVLVALMAGTTIARMIDVDLSVQLSDKPDHHRHHRHQEKHSAKPVAFAVSVSTGGDYCSPNELQCCPLGDDNEEHCKCMDGRNMLTRTPKLRMNVNRYNIFRPTGEWNCPPPEHKDDPPLVLCCEYGATEPEYQCDCLEPPAPSRQTVDVWNLDRVVIDS